MDKKLENIKKLIDNHLIGSIVGDTSIETYRITTVNLIDFVSKYYVMNRNGMDAIIEINQRDRDMEILKGVDNPLLK